MLEVIIICIQINRTFIATEFRSSRSIKSENWLVPPLLGADKNGAIIFSLCLARATDGQCYIYYARECRNTYKYCINIQQPAPFVIEIVIVLKVGLVHLLRRDWTVKGYFCIENALCIVHGMSESSTLVLQE